MNSIGASPETCPSNQRYRHVQILDTEGRLVWQKGTGYGERVQIETTMGRYKSLIGSRLRARGFKTQQTEAAIGAAVLNRMLATVGPHSIRR